MKLALRIVYTPIIFVICIPIALCVAVMDLVKFPIDMVVGMWKEE